MDETRREVIWTPGARTDLDEIVAYIARDSELFVKRHRLFYEIREREVHALGLIHGGRELKGGE